MNRVMQALVWASSSSAFAYCFMLAAFDDAMPLAWLVLVYLTALVGSLVSTRGAR